MVAVAAAAGVGKLVGWLVGWWRDSGNEDFSRRRIERPKVRSNAVGGVGGERLRERGERKKEIVR